MNSPLKQNRITGFTLLELLVAMALMELLALSLYGSMHIAIKAKRSCVAAVKPSRSLIPAFEFISKDLACVLKPGGILAAEFEGTNDLTAQGFGNDTIAFYSCSYVAGEDEIAGDIVKTEYSLQARDGWDGFVLVRSRTKNLLSPRTVAPDEEVICRGIKSLDIIYYDGYDWLGTWDSSTSENALPEAVEVSITMVGDEKTQTKNGSRTKEVSRETMKRVIILTCADDLVESER